MPPPPTHRGWHDFPYAGVSGGLGPASDTVPHGHLSHCAPGPPFHTANTSRLALAMCLFPVYMSVPHTTAPMSFRREEFWLPRALQLSTRPVVDLINSDRVADPLDQESLSSLQAHRSGLQNSNHHRQRPSSPTERSKDCFSRREHL